MSDRATDDQTESRRSLLRGLQPSSDQRGFFDIAGVTVQVESDMPFSAGTSDEEFGSFAVEGPGADTVVIRHDFGLSDDEALAAAQEGGEEVFRRPPSAITRAQSSWVYLGIAPQADDGHASA
ncbi:MAG TPA: hypothetical protein VFH61_04755 [Thermoleophilia bacterium]|nr:hypothetical protein [Thermoleophilia bacterium]